MAEVKTHYRVNNKRTLADVESRITEHLTPGFRWPPYGGSHDGRHARVYRGTTGGEGVERRDQSGTRDRQTRVPARAPGRQMIRAPHVPMLREDNVRQGFFERRPVRGRAGGAAGGAPRLVTFAYSGLADSVRGAAAAWAQVDRKAQTVRLEPGTDEEQRRAHPPYDLLPELVESSTGSGGEHERLKKTDASVPPSFTGTARPSVSSARRWSGPRGRRRARASSCTTSGARPSGTSSGPACQRRPRCSSPATRRAACSTATTS